MEVLSMTIKFRGYLKNNNQLKSVDESRLEKMAIGWIDYLFVFLIIIYLFVCKDNHSFCIRLHIEVRFGFFICEKGGLVTKQKGQPSRLPFRRVFMKSVRLLE